MKKVIFIALLVLLVGGVGAGYYLGTRSDSTSSNNTTEGDTEKVATSGKVLDLSSSGLTKVGAEVYGKTSTTELVLSNNSIKSLPSEMGKMTKVTTFKIDHNLLEGSLIGEIRQMSNLKTLDVSYNNMTGMPAEIGQLSRLETLDYSYNNIDGLPNELANLKNNLKEFDLTGNPLSEQKITDLRSALPNTTIIF